MVENQENEDSEIVTDNKEENSDEACADVGIDDAKDETIVDVNTNSLTLTVPGRY